MTRAIIATLAALAASMAGPWTQPPDDPNALASSLGETPSVSKTVASLTSDEAAAMVPTPLPRVEELRRLKFKHPVPVKVVDDAAAKAHFKGRMKKFVTEAQMQAEQIAYTQLGLLPKGDDLQASLFSVLEEQA